VSLHANPPFRVTIGTNVHHLLLEIQQNDCSLRWRAVREKQTDNHCPVQWSLLSLIVPHATFAIVVATSSHLHNLVYAVITNCQTHTCLCSSRKHNLSDVLTAPSKKKMPFTVYQPRFTGRFEIIFYLSHDIFTARPPEDVLADAQNIHHNQDIWVHPAVWYGDDGDGGVGLYNIRHFPLPFLLIFLHLRLTEGLCSLIWFIIPALAWKVRGKSRMIPVMIYLLPGLDSK
jgi:hypothetical protein